MHFYWRGSVFCSPLREPGWGTYPSGTEGGPWTTKSLVMVSPSSFIWGHKTRWHTKYTAPTTNRNQHHTHDGADGVGLRKGRGLFGGVWGRNQSLVVTAQNKTSAGHASDSRTLENNTKTTWTKRFCSVRYRHKYLLVVQSKYSRYLRIKIISACFKL